MSKLIFVDIGHGSDTWEKQGGKGVVKDGKVYEEHSFNADVGIKVKELLELNGFQVVFPQPPYQSEVELQVRTDMANQAEADLYWSIHANANNDESVSGRCAFYWYTSEASQRLAELYTINVTEAGYSLHGDGLHVSRPDSWTNLHVCRETKMPAVLTENGFMTNPNDFELIFGQNSEEYRRKIAETHAKSVCQFFGVEYNDSREYRLITGTWTIAEGIVNAKKKLREAGYGMTLYEVAERQGNSDYRILDPDYRLLTGVYVGRNNAEAKAEELRNKFGWNIYVIEA